jgi:monoamine oxidase
MSAASAAAVVAAPGTATAGTRSAGERRRRRIVVVGAGITSARTLVDRGYQVTVLEARDRLGGRIHTSHRWADAPIDLGASWIHEIRGNPLTDIARDAGLSLATTDYNSAVTYDAKRGLLDTGAGSRHEAMSKQVAGGVKSGYRLRADRPLRAHLERTLGFDDLSAFDRRLANHMTVSMAELDYAGDSAQLSSWHWDSMSGYAGLDAVLPAGYGAMIDHLAEGLDVRLGDRVLTVAHNSSGVRITSSRGRFDADAVIVTVPLGALQRGAITFSPGLPRAKAAAVRARSG